MRRYPMALFTTYQVKRELDAVAPFLAFVVLAMAVEEAIATESLEPVMNLIGDFLEGM
jgi:hypothetical protein